MSPLDALLLPQLIDLNNDLVVVFFAAPHEVAVSRLRLQSLIQHIFVLVFDPHTHNRNAFLDALLDARDVSLPIRVILIISHLWSHHKHVDFLLGITVALVSTPEAIIQLDHGCVVGHDVELGLQTESLLGLNDTPEGVAHKGNEHVEEGDLGEEGSREEEEVDQVSLWIIIKVVHGELSKRQHVLIVEHIEWPDLPKDFVDDWVFIRAVQLQHVHRHSKHGESDDEDDHEVPDVVDGLIYETNEEGSFLEELAPVEYLDPEGQHGERSEDSLRFNLWHFKLEQVDNDDVDG